MTTTGLAAHALSLSQTNRHGVVPVCACGWIGSVHLAHRAISKGESRGRWLWDGAGERAEHEHAEHVRLVRPLTATLAPEQYVGTVLNTKRFGHA